MVHCKIETVHLVAVALLRHLQLLLHFRLEGFEIEARPFLHRRELEETLSCLSDLLLHEDEAPELILVPAYVIYGSSHPRSLERIEAEVQQDRPVRFDGTPKPAVRLVNEPVFEVVYPHRSKC